MANITAMYRLPAATATLPDRLRAGWQARRRLVQSSVRQFAFLRVRVMPADSSSVEAEYQARMDALLPKERIARSVAMFQWVREMIARQIRKQCAAEGKAISAEELKWRVALRMYGGEPAVAAMIRQRLEDVSA